MIKMHYQFWGKVWEKPRVLSLSSGLPATKCRSKILGNSKGFSYLSLMAMIIIIGISMTAVAYQWKTIAKREKEKELLFRGNAIRSAILQYVGDDPLKRYPHSIEDLMKDPKSPNPRRYLRKYYKDPMTGRDFALMMDPVRGLVGVHSESTEKPIKTSNFKVVDRCFEDKKQYRQWLFMVDTVPGNQPVIAASASTAGAGTVPGNTAVPQGVGGVGTNAAGLPPITLPCPPTNTLTDEKQ